MKYGREKHTQQQVLLNKQVEENFLFATFSLGMKLVLGYPWWIQ